MNPFDVKSALLAKHVQHVVIIRRQLQRDVSYRRDGQPPRAMYSVVASIMAVAIAFTGHLGGILSGLVTVNQQAAALRYAGCYVFVFSGIKLSTGSLI